MTAVADASFGVTGHQLLPDRAGAWLRQSLRSICANQTHLSGYTSLATGADQLFADVLLEIGGSLVAVIPFPDYVETFAERIARDSYERLLAKAREVVVLSPGSSDEESFLSAGRYVVDHVQQMIAIWDGEPARGIGGTADVVSYAVARGVPTVQLDPKTMMRRALQVQVLGRER